MIFLCRYGKIISLKRGAAEHEYRAPRRWLRDLCTKRTQKGIAAEAQQDLGAALGVRENTRSPVTATVKRFFGRSYEEGEEGGHAFFFYKTHLLTKEFIMQKQYKVGVIGATGMVGQRFVTLLDGHPLFRPAALAASARSAGKSYEEAVGSRWAMSVPMPSYAKDMILLDAESDAEKLASLVDFVFCAVNMKKEEIKALEEKYAKLEVPVVSNNSAHRATPDVPMIIPEINDDHLSVIAAQRRRLGTKRGFIAVKSNCSLQSYVPLLHPLMKFGIKCAAVTTYQAISGAGKTFETMPEIVDNIIPYIGGEEQKSEEEPLKIWGSVKGNKIVNATGPVITSQCLRVPVSDGHTAAVFVSFERKPSKEEIISAWKEFSGAPQALSLPSAPKQFIHYFEEDNRPQAKLDRMTENGMAVCAGRLREDVLFDYKFIGLSHNTLRGAAGGAVLLAELLAAKGYFD